MMVATIVEKIEGVIYTFLISVFFLLFSIPAFAQSSADLFIESAEPVSADLASGDWAKFKVMVKNGGSAAVSDVRVDLYKNRPGAPQAGARGQVSHLITRIEAGQSVRVDFYYRVYSGNYQVHFQVDPDAKVAESDEGNNLFSYDLSVSGERTDDEYEQNDSFSAAKSLISSSGTSFEKSLVSKDDDYYTIYSSGGRFIRIEMRHDYVTADLDIELFDKNQNLVARSATHADLERIQYKTTQTGNYYLRVRTNGQNSNSYHLNIWRGPLPDYTIAIKNVNHVLFTEQMEELFSNLPQYAVPEDEDDPKYLLYVTFEVTDRNRAEIDEEPVNYKPFYVDLYFNRSIKPAPDDVGDFYGRINKNKFQETVTVDPDFGDDYERWTNTAEKEFLILVGPGVYTLSAAVDTGDEAPESSEDNNIAAMHYHKVTTGAGLVYDVDEFEPESDLYPGAWVSPGRHENLMAWDGNEYYRVSVPAGKKLEFSIDFEHKLGNLNLFRLGSTYDKELASSTSSTNRETISVLNTTSSAKTYFFRVGHLPVQKTLRIDDGDDGYTYETVYEYIQNPKYAIDAVITDWADTDGALKWIGINPSAPEQGSNMTVSVTVSNNGVTPLEMVNVDLFRLLRGADAPSAQDSSDYQSTIELLNPGQEVVVDFELAVSNGDYSLYAILDANNAISENSEENNSYGPVNYSVYSGQDDDSLESVTISGEIYENDNYNGEGRPVPITAGTHLNLKAFDDDWYSINLGSEKRLNALANFDSTLGDIDLSFYKLIEVDNPDSPGQKIWVAALLRYGGALGDYESISYYNSSSSSEEILILARPTASNSYNLELSEVANATLEYPDLVIDSVITNPTNPVGGDLITTIVSVRNAGNWITTADATVDLYHSTVPRVGNYGDLFQVIKAGMEPGEVRYFTFEYTLAGGGYPIYLIADPDNSVIESSEKNNLYGPIELQVSGGSNGNISVSGVSSSLYGHNANVSFDMPNSTLRTDFYIKFRLLDGPNASANVVYEWTKSYQSKYNSVGGVTNLSYSLPFDYYVPKGPLYMQVIADWGNWIGETDETDNSAYSGAMARNTMPGLSISTFGAPSEEVATDTVLELYKYTGAGVVNAQTSVTGAQLGSPIRTIDGQGPYASARVGLPTGYYFARVYSYGESTGPYYFAYGPSPSAWSVSGAEAIDTTEGDNSYSSPRRPALDSVSRLQISSRSDEDWFAFVVHNFQIDFGLLDNIDGVSAKVYRYSGSGAVNFNNITTGDLVEAGQFVRGGQSFYFQSALPAGTYFIKVSGANASYSTVVRNNNLTPQNPAPLLPGNSLSADSYEADNALAEAVQIGYNQRQSRTLYKDSGSDTDWIYIELTSF